MTELQSLPYVKGGCKDKLPRHTGCCSQTQGFSGAEMAICGDFQGLTRYVCEQPNLDSVLTLL